MTSELSGSKISWYWGFASLGEMARLSATPTEQPFVGTGVHGSETAALVHPVVLIVFSSSLSLATGSVP